MKTVIAIAALSLLTGCASISGERMQPITVKTVHDNVEIAGVGCTLSNDAGSWFVTSPGSVTVHKSTGDLAVDCKKETFAGNHTLVSKSNGAVWGNVLIGGGIGYIVDRNTGAGFDYPASATIMLRKIGDTSPTTQPPTVQPPVAMAAANIEQSTIKQ
ncbi:hypothetical protein [Massilia sp. TN1-12]|uniref:hypothetical protein n=1 Tax=Massilia paldalensis TaxID=3377675 RepID=UPI00385055E1